MSALPKMYYKGNLVKQLYIQHIDSGVKEEVFDAVNQNGEKMYHKHRGSNGTGCYTKKVTATHSHAASGCQYVCVRQGHSAGGNGDYHERPYAQWYSWTCPICGTEYYNSTPWMSCNDPGEYRWSCGKTEGQADGYRYVLGCGYDAT